MLPPRKARPNDLPSVQRIVEEAYSPYVSRLGREPGPMLDNYAGRIAAGQVEVVDGPGGLDAILVLVPEKGFLLLDNVAVANAARGQGIGGALIDHAEARARALGLPMVRLYTHELMVENQAIYRKRGYVETHRAEKDGLKRVFMAKAVQPGEGGG